MRIFGKSLQFLLSIVSTGLPESVLTHFFPIIKLLEFCFSFLWQEHIHSKISGAWLCVYVV